MYKGDGMKRFFETELSVHHPSYCTNGRSANYLGSVFVTNSTSTLNFAKSNQNILHQYKKVMSLLQHV